MLTGAVAEAFAKQAGFCRWSGSEFTARVCEAAALALDAGTATGARVQAWPGEAFADALMMRVTGALNALVRRGGAPLLAPLYPPAAAPDVAVLAAAIAAQLADRAADRFAHDFLDSPPQTNEVMRASGLFPGLMTVAAATGLPLRLFELGASAGLNLNMDRFAYVLGGQPAGDLASPLQLVPQWGGPVPAITPVRVASRQGVDIAPLDVTDAAVRERLLAFVWPDQRERVARAEAAIQLALAHPPPLQAGDAADFVEAAVAPQPGTVTLVYHSIAHQYFPPATQARLAAHMAAMGAAASADAPLAWLRFEMDDPAQAELPTLRLALWRGGAREDRLLARVHPHGSAVNWLAA
ncbi:MAG: DUF2332 family protein [Sphingomonadales bacterium]